MAHDNAHGNGRYQPGEVAWGAEHHILPIRTYALTILALFVLMAATIWVAHFDLGGMWNNLIAMTIAITKATLVVMFFMHVKYNSNLVRIYALAGFVWLAMLFYILVDYWARPLDPGLAESWMHDPGSALTPNQGQPQSHPADPFAVNVRPRP